MTVSEFDTDFKKLRRGHRRWRERLKQTNTKLGSLP